MGRPGEASEDVEGQLARIRRAIMTIGDQIETARTGAGTTIVSRAELDRTLREQSTALGAAHTEVRSAAAAAAHAAGAARTEAGAAAAAPYEQAEAGFAAQLAVIETAQAELSQLSQASVADARHSRELLRRTLRSLEEAMREQLVLLNRLEQVQRELAIAEQRRRRHG